MLGTGCGNGHAKDASIPAKRLKNSGDRLVAPRFAAVREVLEGRISSLEREAELSWLR
jgi:hypothetical protein